MGGMSAAAIPAGEGLISCLCCAQLRCRGTVSKVREAFEARGPEEEMALSKTKQANIPERDVGGNSKIIVIEHAPKSPL